jgi:AraC-like DNA-binding protein
MHRHTSCELLFLHEGKLEIISENGNKQPLNKGMLYLIPGCVSHRTAILDKSVYNRTLLFINPWTYSRAFFSETINRMLMGFCSNEPIVVEDTFGCEKLLEKLADEYALTDPLAEGMCISIVTEILTGIVRQSRILSVGDTTPGRLVTEVQDYIRKNCGSQILISELAEHFFVSKFYLSHIFKEQTGMSPKSFLTETRLTKAYNLLYEKDLKISEISELCGFVSPSDMTKRFREHYGVSPSEFRKNIFASKQNIGN